jgi:hypothetical protein
MSIVERQKPPSNDPGLHERMAVLEDKVRRLESAAKETSS